MVVAGRPNLESGRCFVSIPFPRSFGEGSPDGRGDLRAQHELHLPEARVVRVRQFDEAQPAEL